MNNLSEEITLWVYFAFDIFVKCDVIKIYYAVMGKNIGTLGKYDQRSAEIWSAFLIFLIFYLKKSQKSNWIIRI